MVTQSLVQSALPAQEVVPADLATRDRVFLATENASPRAARFVLAVILVSAMFFAAAVPFAKVQLAQVPAFIAAYEAALIICDLITAVLLFGQFNFLRSRAVLVLASGYIYTALIAFAHALSYPNLFAPAGLLGGGSQTTAWLYFFWHGSFPLFVIAYALVQDKGTTGMETSEPGLPPPGGAGNAILAASGAAFAAVCGLTLLATAGEPYLPVLMAGHRFSSALNGLPLGIALLSVLALLVVWWRRPHTVLDLWLMVVLCAGFFNMALGAVFNTGRFDLGFYAGRLYGLLAASFVLIVLLFENSMHYARLVQLSRELGEANKRLERLSMQDGLTELANRRLFDAYLDAQIAVAHRHKRSLALIMCDVDGFKDYNDNYGHPAGDACLKEIAAALRSCCRRSADMVARYGGEEFAMILPDTELTGAAKVAEALCIAVTRLEIPHAHSSACPHVSISGGVAVLLRKIDMSAQQLIAAADQALYEAKNLGRNRMVCVLAEAG